jgi:hypothetical protein
LALAASGEGAVVDDNAATIDATLSDYNASVPTPRGSAEHGGFCGLRAPFGGGASRSAGLAWLALAAGALVQRARTRRA